MVGKTTHYFANGNTAEGFYSLYDSCLAGMDRIFILVGSYGTEQGKMINEIGSYWKEKGYNIEFLHSPADPEILDGVIIPSIRAAVIDGSPPRKITPKALGVIEHFVYIGEAWDHNELALNKDTMMQATKEISNLYEQAYATFKEAQTIYDEWEKIYIDSLDFEKANQLTEKLIHSFYGNMSLNKKSTVKHRFLGAATPEGAVDFIPNITRDIPKRYFLKGRPGSGKSTILKKIGAAGEERGFDIELYHCGFDPKSIDMVTIRELGITIFDSTPPHEYFPAREGDEIIDLYESLMDPGTDEIFEEQISSISKNYKAKMKEGISYLAKAKEIREKLAQIYFEATDHTILSSLQEKVQQSLEELKK